MISTPSKPRERNTIVDILKNFDENSQTALLCPKKHNYKFSASYLLGGDVSGRIRYWNIEKQYHKCKHFYLADDEELEYKKKRFQGTFHIMMDKISKINQEEGKDNTSFMEEGKQSAPHTLDILPVSKGTHDGHSSSITSFGILYKDNAQG